MARKIVKKGSDLLADVIVHGIQEKKGEDIVTLNLKNLPNAVTDYFIICSGTSNTQVDAITDSIEKEVKDALGEKPISVEGKQNSEWILMDYVNVVVHVFQKDIRQFYNLEALWADAEIAKIA